MKKKETSSQLESIRFDFSRVISCSIIQIKRKFLIYSMKIVPLRCQSIEDILSNKDQSILFLFLFVKINKIMFSSSSSSKFYQFDLNITEKNSFLCQKEFPWLTLFKRDQMNKKENEFNEGY